MADYEHERSLWKGAVAGVAGGLAAAWIMNQFQNGLSKASQSGSSNGQSLHYVFGTTMGAAYGAMAELAPRTTSLWGTSFGTALWLGADEVAVPAFGLSKPPFDSPASTHASALASHLVYGATVETVRRGVRAALGR